MLETLLAFSLGAVVSIIIGYFVTRIMINNLHSKNQEYTDHLNELHRIDLKDRENLRGKIDIMINSASKIEKEASTLSSALKSDVKFQGAWGEMILENILELSGLEKGREYSLQSTLKDDDANSYRPDAIIFLPNNSQIIIDSKVSLKAYFDYINLGQTDTALKDLKKSVQTHIDQLSKKNYQNLQGVNSPDFVYLFVPVEGVYALMLKEFPQLIDESLKKNIVLASPVNLIANLKTVASLWRFEKQSKNAEEMAQKAGSMYDKFSAVYDDVEKMGVCLNRAQTIHDDLLKKIGSGKGNLLARAEELRALGAKTSKDLPEQNLN